MGVWKRTRKSKNNKNDRLFPSSPGPLYQKEVRCSTFDVEMIFHSHANKTHFHMKGCAPNLVLIQRPGRTRKRPISSVHTYLLFENGYILYRFRVPSTGIR